MPTPLRGTLTAVAEWSTSKKMVFNADKCKVTFFSTKFHEVNWQPTIISNNTRLHHNPQLTFLGVTLDEHKNEHCLWNESLR